MSRTTIVLADDHPLMLHGLTSLISLEADFEIVARCQDGEAALAAIRANVPDVALIDLRMPRLDGMAILSALNGQNIHTRAVFLCASITDEEIYAASGAGAWGLILKEAAPDTILQCLRDVAAGRRWVPALVTEALAREKERREAGRLLAKSLTAREREITLLVSQSFSNKEIARQLGLSEGTVKIHIHNIYRKIGVAKRSALSELAIRFRDHLV
jgi:DNA-binding NarL/FixJ family response regulator